MFCEDRSCNGRFLLNWFRMLYDDLNVGMV
jgi:hypothetical protein